MRLAHGSSTLYFTDFSTSAPYELLSSATDRGAFSRKSRIIKLTYCKPERPEIPSGTERPLMTSISVPLRPITSKQSLKRSTGADPTRTDMDFDDSDSRRLCMSEIHRLLPRISMNDKYSKSRIRIAVAENRIAKSKTLAS
jgi:hypothetical protein